MLGIGECVDGGQAARGREDFQIALRVRADDRPVQHAAEDARRVLDRLTAAAEMQIGRIEKQGVPAQLADTDPRSSPASGSSSC